MLAALAVTCLASGCAIYSDARDKQGQATKEAWGKVDLKAQIEIPRRNLKALLDEQLAVEDEIWKSRRGHLAQAMVSGWKVSDLSARVGDGLTRVAGSAGDAGKVLGASARARVAQDGLDSIERTLAIIGQPLPSCTRLLDPEQRKTVDAEVALIADPNKRGAAQGLVEPALTHCQTLKRESEVLPTTGELVRAQADLTSAAGELERDKGRAEAAMVAYKSALREYEEAASALAVDPSGARQKVDNALEKLRTVAGQLTDAQEAFSTKLISEERLASLDRFLSTYADVVAGKGAQEGSSRAAIALAVFPDLVDKARQALSDLEKPNLVPLVLQKNVEQAKLEAAQRDVDRRLQLLALRQAHVDGLMAQAAAYSAAAAGLAGADVQSLASSQLAVALQPFAANAPAAERQGKAAIWKAVARYLDAEGRLRAEVGKTRYRITALEHEKALTYAESSVNQWKALIDPSVEMIAAYGASGLKSSDITAFVNSVTLLWIGIGVN